MFDGFTFARFSFHLKAKDLIELPPYKGSTFRGGFGCAFKKVVCTVRSRDCEVCILKSRCVYFYIFETQPPEGSEALRLYKRIPHPFVIEPPLEIKRNYMPGETLSFNLVLIGRAVDYLPYFIHTFEELGAIGIGKGRGKYMLTEVRIPGKGDLIYSGEERTLKGCPKSLTPLDILKPRGKGLEDTAYLNFLTPLRLVINNDLIVELKFHHLISSLLRRVSTLSYFHCGKRIEIDFKGLIERAKLVEVIESELKWLDWERYSTRQNARMKMGGLVGRIGFRGKLGEFMPLLYLGEALHVGKGTSFGLGKYELRISS